MTRLANNPGDYWVGLWAFLHAVVEDMLHGLWMEENLSWMERLGKMFKSINKNDKQKAKQ